MAFAFPVLSEDEAKKHIAGLRKQYHDARHHCFAWRIGPKGENFRAFDDGEPSGTAGRPILGQLQSYGYTNALVVVVRYFGGTLLGTGGLTEAYKLAAKDALTKAIIKTCFIVNTYSIRCEYIRLGWIMALIKEMDLPIVEQKMGERVELILTIRTSREEEWLSRLKTILDIEWKKEEYKR